MQYAEVFRWLTGLYTKVPYYFLGGYAFPPMFIYLRITRMCNLSCKHCYVSQCRQHERIRASEEDLTFSEIRQLMEQVNRKAVISVIGDEIFTRSDIMDILELISRRNPCRLLTNGTLISEEGCEALIHMGSEHIFGKGVISAAVSLHGPNETIHDGITTVAGSYYKTVDTVRRLVEIKKRRRKKYPLIDLTIVILKENAEGLDDMFELAEELGVDSCNFMLHRKIMPREDQADGGSVNILYKLPPKGDFIEPSIITDQLRSLVRRAQRSHVQLRFTPASMPISEIIRYYTNGVNIDDYACCSYPWLRLIVEANGDVGLCHYHTHGSIRKKRISDLWNSKEYETFRKTLRRNRIFPGCYGCSNLYYVGGSVGEGGFKRFRSS
jgi:radical SAM protein with 4Fe4S-binding SPASM domain